MRSLALTAGLAGAVTLAQAPEFTQQYAQRLGGAVDALGAVTADFDRSAAAAGLSREEAFTELSGSTFLNRRGTDMRATFARFEDLKAQQVALAEGGPLASLNLLAGADGELAGATWGDFRPAIPTTGEGAALGAAGFGVGYWVWRILVGLLVSLASISFLRRRA